MCEFLCQLHSRGYQLFFLTARGLVGPAGIERTRRYLFEIAIDRESGFRLPQSPLFTTRHTSTMSALKEELGLGSGGGSKAFKLAQLRQIQSLFEPPPAPSFFRSFPSPPNPGGGLYAGFGNRPKDAWAYNGAGVAAERIFIIDPASRLEQMAASAASSASAASADKAAASSSSGGASSSDGGAAEADDAAESSASASASGGTSGGGGGGCVASGTAWASYAGMLRETQTLDRIFPLQCTSPQQMQMLARYAAMAAASLPNGTGRTHRMSRRGPHRR